MGDPSLLRRVLTNLLGNAVKYSPPDTTVRLVLAEDGKWCEIDVVDEGYGISADQMDRLFTRHARVSRPASPTSRASVSAWWIVKTIVDRHGGGVSVESAPGAGSTFRVRLPRAASRHG
ncbi:MAG: ATP-binding protein [Rhodocyclaceae bacterium]|nr:ATP-binding protein [Rhodocyclaceae bacterium]